jgi:hypothetical protein
MYNGCIEIDNINTQASTEVIRKLKSILDQHTIFHIIDGVVLNQPHKQGSRMNTFHPDRVREISKIHDDFRLVYRELVVPDLYRLNYMSLAYFDSEEVDFLAILICGED